MRFLVLLVFCPAAICYNFDEDFNSLYEQSCGITVYKVKKLSSEIPGACIFNHSEVTTQTIDLWPSNCKFICTVLTFTANSNDIPLEKLNSTFKNLTKIKGSLRVENTSFTNLSFLDSVKSVYNYAFLDLSIKNNPNLIEAKVLYAVEYTFTNSPINVVNNTKLDASQLCVNENYGEFVRMYVYNNKKDCGCIGTNFTTANVKNYKNCTAMYGALEIANIPDASSFAGLEKLKTITGNITIHSTGFQNLSFFKNLISIVGDEDDDVPTLSIQDNPNMTRLSINSLTKLYNVKSWFYMSIKNNHPSFCLTMEEMQFFTSTNTKFTNIQAVYCNTTIRKDNQKTCIFGTWSTLDSDCVHLMGKVVIGSGDEGYSGKLSTVKNIYGSLTIQNTTLSDIRFLSNLTNVALLNDTIPAVQLINNFNLSDVSLPKMMYPFTPGPSRVIISNNAPDIFLDVDACYNYEQDMGSAIVYNGANCSMMSPDYGEKTNGTDVGTGNTVNCVTYINSFSLVFLTLRFG